MLWSMGVYHADDAVTSDGIFRADIVLDGEKVRPEQSPCDAEALSRSALPGQPCACCWGMQKWPAYTTGKDTASTLGWVIPFTGQAESFGKPRTQ